MLINVDGYIKLVPDDAAYLTFRSSWQDRVAGRVTAHTKDGKEIELTNVGAEFNLPQKPWWDRITDPDEIGVP